MTPKPIKVTHKEIPVDSFDVDLRVQRTEGVDERRAATIAAVFDKNAMGTVTASQRPDGSLILLDGRHRTTAAKLAGYTGKVSTNVFTGLTLEDEARLFLALNTTKAPSAISKFLVRVVMGDDAAVEMSEILAMHGWRVAISVDPGCMSAVDAMERVYRDGGGTVPKGAHPELLDRVLELITAAWEHDGKGTQAPMLLAVAQLIGRFGPAVDTKKLVDEMQATRPGVLIGKAKVLRDVQGGTVPAALAKILAGMHNKKRRTNLLPEWVWIR